MLQIIQNMMVSQCSELELIMFRGTTLSGQHPLIYIWVQNLQKYSTCWYNWYLIISTVLPHPAIAVHTTLFSLRYWKIWKEKKGGEVILWNNHSVSIKKFYFEQFKFSLGWLIHSLKCSMVLTKMPNLFQSDSCCMKEFLTLRCFVVKKNILSDSIDLHKLIATMLNKSWCFSLILK